MGIFSFTKNVGAKIFGGKTAAEKAADEKAANTQASEKLSQMIRQMDLKADDLNIVINGDTAAVSGTVNDQSTKEKIVLIVGNSEGIAEVDDRLEVEHAEPAAQFHTVESGDSLSKIAKKFYGDAMKYPLIFEANQPMLSDPDKIYPGQVLRIPHVE